MNSKNQKKLNLQFRIFMQLVYCSRLLTLNIIKMNTFENYSYVIWGKKENERYFDLLQEKIKYGCGTVDYIYNENLAKQCEQFYKNKGFITKIEKIKPLSNVNFKKEFN